MNSYVQFDSAGTIHSVVIIDAPDGVQAGIDVEPGLSVAEIDSSDIKPPTTEAELNELVAFAQNYQVSVPEVAKAELKRAK